MSDAHSDEIDHQCCVHTSHCYTGTLCPECSGSAHVDAECGSCGEFLIALSGPYADTEVVLYGDPWDNEADYGSDPCSQCGGNRAPGSMDSLRFPVLVMPSARGASDE